MSIKNLNQSSTSNSFEVLLALLVYEICPGDCPSLRYLGERYGTPRRQLEIICSTKRKIGHELEILYAVRTELKVARWVPIFGFSPKRSKVHGLYAARQADIACGPQIFRKVVRPGTRCPSVDLSESMQAYISRTFQVRLRKTHRRPKA